MLEAIKMYFLPYLINSFSIIYLLHALQNKKINLKNANFYFVYAFFVILSIFNKVFIIPQMRLVIMTIVLLLGNIILFNEKLRYSIIISFFCQVLVCISEIISTLILPIIFRIEYNLFLMNWLDILLYNIFISVILVIFSKINIIKKVYLKLITITNKLSLSILLLYFLLLLLAINILTVLSYLPDDSYYFIYINAIFLIVYSIIIFVAIKDKNEKKQFIEVNKNLINNLNEYEKMLDYQRVNNHENKNQLLVIKSMIEKNKDNVIEYIDEIIKEKREDNEIIYNKAKRIPSGGLQGLIYQKMLLMQENNIEVNLDINSQVRKIDFGNLSSKMNYDICRIAGIIIDNAIEETMKFNKKERDIIISMYIDDMFIIEVSNRIKDDVDLNKIYDKGYTSKEKGHGYGLSLLKKIVCENNKIINEVKIINNIFTQIIKIKM